MQVQITLHSNLVIFQPAAAPYTQEIDVPLHSNLVIFQLISSTHIASFLSSLHSNLVIFQLDQLPKASLEYLTFTFQSGYIPTSHYNTTYLQTLKAAFCRPLLLNPFYRNIFCELFLLSLFRPLLP